ncbi:MAG: DMT family transporter [Chloroflexi bacterium]|nr:DMT family transporter [Chloroflexota bacterium]
MHTPVRASAPEEGSRSRFSPADLGMLLVALTWGANYTLIKVALDVLDPLIFNAVRMLLAMATIWVAARLLHTDLRVDRGDIWKLTLLGLLGNTGYQMFFIHGIDRTTASNTSVMLATSPVMVTVLASLLGIEKVGRWAWLGIAGCVAGIYFLVTGRGEQVAFGAAHLTGDVLVLCGVFMWALFTLGSKVFIRRYSPMTVTFHTMLLGSWPLVLFALPRVATQAWEPVGWQAMGAAVVSGVLAIGVSYIIWNYGVKHLGASRTAVYVTVPPVITAIVGWFVLGERFSGLQWLGAALTLAGVALTRLAKAGPPDDRPAPPAQAERQPLPSQGHPH